MSPTVSPSLWQNALRPWTPLSGRFWPPKLSQAGDGHKRDSEILQRRVGRGALLGLTALFPIALHSEKTGCCWCRLVPAPRAWISGNLALLSSARHHGAACPKYDQCNSHSFL